MANISRALEKDLKPIADSIYDIGKPDVIYHKTHVAKVPQTIENNWLAEGYQSVLNKDASYKPEIQYLNSHKYFGILLLVMILVIFIAIAMEGCN